MTYNVLHEGVRSLLPPWPVRRPLVAAVIRSAHPDVACLQEVSSRQLEDLRADLPDYVFRPGRLTGRTEVPRWARLVMTFLKPMLGDFLDRGEHCPILVRRDWGVPIDSASVPLSGPDGSAENRTPTPHVVNWVRIRSRSGDTVDVFTTHLGHMPGRGRRTGAALFRLADERWNGNVQVLTGDFNTMPFTTLVHSLTRRRSGAAPPFEDAFAEARSRVGGRTTFHWGLGLPGPRLDYVLVRPPCTVERVEVTGKRIGKTIPSDHYALVADLRTP